MRVAGRLHGGVEGERVGVLLRAPRVEHRREVGAAAEPGFRRHDEAGVHVHRRHVRDSADARSAKCREPKSADRPRRRGSHCGIPARTRRTRSRRARRPFRTRARASSPSRRRRQGRRLPAQHSTTLPPVWSVRCHAVRLNRPAGRSLKGASAGSASSTPSKAITSRSRNASNQVCAVFFRCSGLALFMFCFGSIARNCWRQNVIKPATLLSNCNRTGARNATSDFF